MAELLDQFLIVGHLAQRFDAARGMLLFMLGEAASETLAAMLEVMTGAVALSWTRPV